MDGRRLSVREQLAIRVNGLRVVLGKRDPFFTKFCVERGSFLTE
jgi:hypothetical protein